MLGSPRITDDFDICPETSPENLERLAAMLNEINARWRPEGPEQGFDPVEPWNARGFGTHTSLALLTSYGSLDVWFRPHGTSGYADLIEKAVELQVDDLRVKVVNLEDSIRIKRAIGGPKYLGHLPLLRELQQQRRERGLE